VAETLHLKLTHDLVSATPVVIMIVPILCRYHHAHVRVADVRLERLNPEVCNSMRTRRSNGAIFSMLPQLQDLPSELRLERFATSTLTMAVGSAARHSRAVERGTPRPMAMVGSAGALDEIPQPMVIHRLGRDVVVIVDDRRPVTDAAQLRDDGCRCS
jgi:hypothetical protein